MFDRNYNIENPGSEILAYLEANQPGCTQLRRRAVIYFGDDGTWKLQACVIEGISAKREIEPEEPRRYQASVVLYEDWLSLKELEEVIGRIQDGWLPLGEYNLDASSSHRRWERVRQPLRNPYMQHPGYVWTSSFQDLYNSKSGELIAPDLPYYPDLHEAVMHWLPFPIYRQSSDQNKGEVIVLLPETRAYFESATHQGDHVDLAIAGTGARSLPLMVSGAWWDKEHIHHFSAAVADGHATVEVPEEARRLDYVLLDTDGGIYDFQQENEHHHSGLGILRREGDTQTLTKLVLDACRNGEGLHTEFKPYIKPDNDKLAEVIRTVASFANAEGGHIFLGISDGCEIEGIDEPLREATRSTPNESVCAQYLAALGSKIREDLRGNLELLFFPVNIDGRWIAAIEVAEATQKPITTRREDRVLYVRRGSTNARARPEEWVAIADSVGSNPLGSLRQRL